VLLDLKADQSMIEEGMAREVINRMQKLRKKAGLVPTDQVTVHYGITPANSELERITNSYLSFIENTIKMPVKPKSEMGTGNIIMDENQQVCIFYSSLNCYFNKYSNSSWAPSCTWLLLGTFKECQSLVLLLVALLRASKFKNKFACTI